jgi:hypothetical protein
VLEGQICLQEVIFFRFLAPDELLSKKMLSHMEKVKNTEKFGTPAASCRRSSQQVCVDTAACPN